MTETCDRRASSGLVGPRRAVSPLRLVGRLDRQVFGQSADLEEADDRRAGLADHQPTVVGLGALVCFDDEPEPARIDELDRSHVEDDVAAVAGERVEVPAEVRCRVGVDLAAEDQS